MQETAVQILKAIRVFLIRDDSFTRGQTPISVTGHWRILSFTPCISSIRRNLWNLYFQPFLCLTNKSYFKTYRVFQQKSSIFLGNHHVKLTESKTYLKWIQYLIHVWVVGGANFWNLHFQPYLKIWIAFWCASSKPLFVRAWLTN